MSPAGSGKAKKKPAKKTTTMAKKAKQPVKKPATTAASTPAVSKPTAEAEIIEGDTYAEDESQDVLRDELKEALTIDRKEHHQEDKSVLGDPKMVDLLAASPQKIAAEGMLVPDQHDILLEVGHIGAGRATGELSKLVGAMVKLERPEVQFFSVENPPPTVVGDGNVVAILSKIQGAARGEIMTIWEADSSIALLDLVHKRPLGTTKNLSEEADKDKLVEIGSGLGERYLAAVSSLMEVELLRENFQLVAADSKAFTSYLLVSILGGSDQSIYLRLVTEFSTVYTEPRTKKKKDLSGKFILLLELDSVIGMIKALKEQLEKIDV